MKTKLLATAAALLMATSAQSAIVSFNTPIAVPNNIDGVYVNLLTGATGSSGASTPGWDINPYLVNGVFSFFWNNVAPSVSGGVAATTDGVYLDLPAGSVVSSASLFSAAAGGGGAGSTIAFQSTGIHTLGFRFRNEATAATNYGYMTIQNTGPNGFPATILNWSFENTGGAITVAAIPEPATWAMMIGGFGMAGSALRYRRRKTSVSFA